MRIVDRYITSSIVTIFLITLVVFGMLFVLIDSTSHLDEFIDRHVPFEILIQYYLAYLPSVIVQTASMACLIAVLLTYSNLNHHNEIIVLRSSGLGFWKLARPALIFTVLISAIIFFVNERYVPQTENLTNEIKRQSLSSETGRKKKKRPKIKELTFYGLRNRLYYIDVFDPNTYELQGITIIEYDNQQNVKEKIMAVKGKWTGIAWKFFQCHITEFPEDLNEKVIVKMYDDKLVDIRETPEDFIRQRLNVRAMNIKQLMDYINRFSSSGATRALNNLRVDLDEKFAFPFTTIVIVLMGLPLAMMSGRRRAQTFTSLGIAIIIGFAYYVSNAVGLALGKGESLPPFLSAWLAPLIFAGIAVYVIWNKF